MGAGAPGGPGGRGAGWVAVSAPGGPGVQGVGLFWVVGSEACGRPATLDEVPDQHVEVVGRQVRGSDG